MLDIQAELHGAGQPFHDLYEAVLALKRRHDLHPCAVRPRDGLSLRNDHDREAVQDLVARFRKLPEDARQKLPALMNSIAQLEVVIGDLEAGQGDFEEVARLVEDPISRAEAHHNVFRAALERGENEAALAAFRRAIELDAETFEPFPTSRFAPKRILGAGALGARFLCEDREMGGEVVALALRTDAVDRDVPTIFREMKAVQELDHPAVARVVATGFGGPEPARPYLVTEYVPDAEPLSAVVARGPLSPEDWFDIAWPLARALQALHNRGVLHRCLRPSSVLVWEREGRRRVKLLDGGLAIRRAAIHAAASCPDRHLTGLGRTVSRLIGYLPSEVTGRPRGNVWVGPHSDVYSFGRLCALALTGRCDPDSADRMGLPEAWQKVIENCTAWTINQRPAHMGPVLDRMASAPGGDERVSRIEQSLNEMTAQEHDAAVEANPLVASVRAARAAARFRQGEFAKAIQDYDDAIRLSDRQDASLFRRRAQAHLRNDATDEAIADYTESLRLEPNNVEALSGRAQVYTQKGEQEKAAEDYTEAIRHAPRDESLYFGRGNAFFSLGQHARAIADYTEAARLDTRHLWSLGNRGRCYLLTGEPARAVADFTRVLQLDPASVKALCDRAGAHLELKRADLAIADYTEAIRLEPSAALHHDRALAYTTAGQHAEAVADFTEALNKAPGSVSLLSARSRSLARLGKLEEALADLDEAVKRSEENVALRTQRAELLERMGKQAGALADLDEAVRLAPESPAGWFARGNLHAEMGDHDRAIADYSEVIRLDEAASPAWCNRGNSYARLGELEQALADLNRAVELAAEDALTLLNRASVHVRMGHTDQALADYSEVLRLDPGSVRGYVNRGVLLAGQGEFSRAIADLDEALRLEPENARALMHRGNAHAENGNREAALADLSRAVELAPNMALAWYNRGIAHSEAGELDSALADFSQALERDPNHLGALINRGIARRRTGEREAALEDFTRAVGAGPTFGPARYNRARVLLDLGRREEALAELDELLRLDGDDVDAYILRGRAHLSGGDVERAIADNEEAARRSPGDPRLANNLGWLLATTWDEARRNGERALEHARRACAAGEDATRLDTLAAALAACGQFEEAVEVQARAVEMAPEADRDDFRSRLELYRAGQAYVQPRPGE